MEKKILSIDFDIIMYPCINLYNGDIDGDDNPIELWKQLEEDYQFENYNILTYDTSVLLELAKLIHYNKEQGKPIYYIDEHQHIVDKIKKDNDYDESTYDIYNVDFHHDLWYSAEDILDIKENDGYHCGCWIGYLYFNKKLSSITWLKAPNSDGLELKTYGGTLDLKTLRIREFDKLYDIDFDEVYFCLSPQWVPQKYKIFYDLIKVSNQ